MGQEISLNGKRVSNKAAKKKKKVEDKSVENEKGVEDLLNDDEVPLSLKRIFGYPSWTDLYPKSIVVGVSI